MYAITLQIIDNHNNIMPVSYLLSDLQASRLIHQGSARSPADNVYGFEFDGGGYTEWPTHRIFSKVIMPYTPPATEPVPADVTVADVIRDATKKAADEAVVSES